MHIFKKISLLIKGDNHQYFDWEECGIRVDVPQGTLSFAETCEINVAALIGGNFTIPENTRLISAAYIVSASESLSQPFNVEIEHCAVLSSPEHSDHLTFVCLVDQDKPPYKFQLIEGGQFHLDSKYGRLSLQGLNIVGIVKCLYTSDKVDVRQSFKHTTGASNFPESILPGESDISPLSRPTTLDDYKNFYEQIKFLVCSRNNEAPIAEIPKLLSKLCTHCSLYDFTLLSIQGI